MNELYVTAFIDTAKEWQTIIASLIALGAAWWTVRTIRHQISEENKRHTESKRSKEWAARAALPDALSQLCRYTERCVSFLNDPNEIEKPNLPTDAINSAKASIEFVDPTSAEKLFELVTHYQIHNARLASYRPNNNQAEWSERVYDAAYLRYLIDRLYEFARNQVDSVPDVGPSHGDMDSALRMTVGLAQFVQDQARYGPVLAIIDHRHPED